jgi:hypothetical protein
MKRYLKLAAVLVTSFGLANLALAHGGGGGGHFGGGNFGGGGHFGGGTHFAPPAAVGHFDHGGRGFEFHGDHGRFDHRFDHRPLFFGGGVPYYYGYGDLGDDGVDTYATTPSVHDSDAVVGDVQRALTHAGYYRYAVDGLWGLTTENAVEAYQKANHLPVTGKIDETLLRSLGLPY